MIEHPTTWTDLLYADDAHRDRARACLGPGWSQRQMAIIASVLTDERLEPRFKVMFARLVAAAGPDLDQPRPIDQTIRELLSTPLMYADPAGNA
jgi:hypothetical protein